MVCMVVCIDRNAMDSWNAIGSGEERVGEQKSERGREDKYSWGVPGQASVRNDWYLLSGCRGWCVSNCS